MNWFKCSELMKLILISKSQSFKFYNILLTSILTKGFFQTRLLLSQLKILFFLAYEITVDFIINWWFSEKRLIVHIEISLKFQKVK